MLQKLETEAHVSEWESGLTFRLATTSLRCKQNNIKNGCFDPNKVKQRTKVTGQVRGWHSFTTFICPSPSPDNLRLISGYIRTHLNCCLIVFNNLVATISFYIPSLNALFRHSSFQILWDSLTIDWQPISNWLTFMSLQGSTFHKKVRVCHVFSSKWACWSLAHQIAQNAINMNVCWTRFLLQMSCNERTLRKKMAAATRSFLKVTTKCLINNQMCRILLLQKTIYSGIY